MGAHFEVYEDHKNEWRWRLRHANGLVLADSGEGYRDKADALKGLASVKDEAPNLEGVGAGTHFEVFRDRSDEWRWRLRHQNGQVLADSGEGYHSKGAAVDGIESLKNNVTTASVKELQTTV